MEKQQTSCTGQACKAYIEQKIVPRIQGDGGWLEVVSAGDRSLRLRLQGECSKCAVASRCLDWIRQEIRRDLGRDVRLEYECRKPFFWDHE